MSVRPLGYAEIREKTEIDNITEIVALAMADLRSVYRPVRSASGSVKPKDDSAIVSLVAIDGVTVVGVVEYCEKDESLYLRGLAVHPKQRRQGIARALVREVEAIAIRKGSSRVTISTIKETGNPQIFTQLGYDIISEAPAMGFEGPDGQSVAKVDMCRMLA